MSRNFKFYSQAAQIVRQGWLQNAFSDGNGNQCLIQSVLTASGQLALSVEMIHELDAHLVEYGSYRRYREVMLWAAEGNLPRFLVRRLSSKGCFNVETRELALQTAMIAWNDSPFRRQVTVVSALEGLANKLELTWLRAEHVRLNEQIDVLRSKVEKLENENSRLRRLTNSFTMRADRRQLEALENELEATWTKLQAQSTSAHA